MEHTLYAVLFQCLLLLAGCLVGVKWLFSRF